MVFQKVPELVSYTTVTNYHKPSEFKKHTNLSFYSSWGQMSKINFTELQSRVGRLALLLEVLGWFHFLQFPEAAHSPWLLILSSHPCNICFHCHSSFPPSASVFILTPVTSSSAFFFFIRTLAIIWSLLDNWPISISLTWSTSAKSFCHSKSQYIWRF